MQIVRTIKLDILHFFLIGSSHLAYNCYAQFLFIQNGDTPLHEASANENVTIVEMLLKAGADPSAVNEVCNKYCLSFIKKNFQI